MGHPAGRSELAAGREGALRDQREQHPQDDLGVELAAGGGPADRLARVLLSLATSGDHSLAIHIALT